MHANVCTSFTDSLYGRVQEDTGRAVGIDIYDCELLQRVPVLIHQHAEKIRPEIEAFITDEQVT